MQFPSRNPRSCTKTRNTLPSRLLSQPCHEVEVRGGREVSKAENNHGSILRQPCRYYFKDTCTSCEYWHPSECQFYQTETGCKGGDKCLFPHHKVDELPNKKPQKELSFPQRKRKRRQTCCGYFEICTPIGLCLAGLGVIGFSKRQTVPGKPEAKCFGINSTGTIRAVHATSSKYPGKQRTIAWKNTSQNSSSAKSPRYEI